MANFVQFISAEYLKENTTVEFNVDDAKINPIVVTAQDMYIAQALGSDFYEYLMEKAFNNSLSNDEEGLIRKFIMPALTHWSHYLLLNQTRAKLTNKSLSLENSQYSNSADRSDLSLLKNEIRDIAEFYTKRLVTYLCDYSNLFPKYDNPSDKENLKKSSNAYFGGVFIPKRSRATRYDQYKN